MLTNPHRARCSTEVIRVRRMTPQMQRVTLAGADLLKLDIHQPAQWVKLFVPAPQGISPVGRAYTIRRFDRLLATIDIDLVLHGDHGPASRWARRAAPGEIVEVAGPRRGHAVNPDARNYLLVGDASALPAIAAILEELPATVRARAFIEVSDVAEHQPLESRARLEVTWLHSGAEPPGTTGQLELAVQAANFDMSNGQVWSAGESFMVRSVRTHLSVDRGVLDSAIDARGYWKLGVADARD
jgi:NADPH-dependent ferric siderophore reductase